MVESFNKWLARTSKIIFKGFGRMKDNFKTNNKDEITTSKKELDKECKHEISELREGGSVFLYCKKCGGWEQLK